MIKRIFLITATLLLLSTSVFADFHYADSTPKNGEVAATSITPENEEIDQPALINYVVPGAVVFMIFIGIGSYWLLFRRKHS